PSPSLFPYPTLFRSRPGAHVLLDLAPCPVRLGLPVLADQVRDDALVGAVEGAGPSLAVGVLKGDVDVARPVKQDLPHLPQPLRRSEEHTSELQSREN